MSSVTMYVRCSSSVKPKWELKADVTQCRICSLETTSKLYFLGHFCETTMKGFQCEECNLIVKTKQNLRNHKHSKHRVVDDTKWLKCQFCDYKSLVKTCMKNHIARKHQDHENNEWLKCTLCAYKTKIEVNFLSHTRRSHKDTTKISCHICQKLYPEHTLKAHISKVHSGTKRKCDFCDKSFKSYNNLKYHCQLAHDVQKVEWWQCPHCDYKTIYKTSIKPHLFRKHNEGTGVKCELCDFVAMSQWYLKDHYYSRHIWFKCASCTFKTRTESLLKRHSCQPK